MHIALIPIVTLAFPQDAAAWLERIPNADPPARVGAMAPNLAQGRNGLLLTWIEPAVTHKTAPDRPLESRHRLRVAQYAGGKWGEPVTIVESDRFFANWADLPSVLETSDGALVAHWLQKSGDATYAYDVILARSEDGGHTWTHLGPAHDDGTQTEHGFVSLIRDGGAARAFWLDGRDMGIDEEEPASGHPPGSMSLRSALIGATVSAATVLDERVCECCDTSAAMTSRGPVVVYRDRGPDEVRDIRIVRHVEGAWTEPRTVHDDGWVISACPVNGPAIDANGDRLVVAWYTGAVEGGAVRVAFSADAGATFAAPVTVDDTTPRGRVDVCMLDTGEAIVSWHDAARPDDVIRLRRFAPDGSAGRPIVVAATTSARQAGFPKIARSGDRLLVVWTSSVTSTRLRATTIPLAEIPAADAR